MRTGSYVYQLNQVIYNLLYNNNSLNNTHQKLANINSSLAMGLEWASYIIVGIQKLLKILYKRINLSYYELSREMEFHADAFACNVAGSESTANALLKIPFAAHIFEITLNFYNERINNDIISSNIFEDHFKLMQYVAERNQYPMVAGFPCIKLEDINKYNRSKISIHNPWDSHPDLKSRVAAIENLNVEILELNHEPAKLLFKNPSKTFKDYTELLYNDIIQGKQTTYWNSAKFMQVYRDQIEQDDLSPIYKGYYDFTNPYIDNINKIERSSTTSDIDHLFSEDRLEVLYIHHALLTDIDLLNAIDNGNIEIENFTYDQIIYKKADIPALRESLIEEKNGIEKVLEMHKIEIFQYFYQQALLLNCTQELEELYQAYKIQQEYYLKDFEIVDKITQFTKQFCNEYLEQIEETELEDFRNIEILFKERLKFHLSNMILRKDLSEPVLSVMEEYCQRAIDKERDIRKSIQQDEVNMLLTCIFNFNPMIEKLLYRSKKELLNFQSDLIQNKNSQIA